jgi:hypothetical protein
MGRLPRKKWLAVVAIAATVALAAKIVLALNTYGTNDVRAWEGFLAKIRASSGLALYHDVEAFNHPPSMIYLLRLWGWAADQTGWPFGFWLRLTSSLADVGSLALVWRILARSPELQLRLSGLLLVALSPVAIMVSGFHGNTDTIMIFFVLLSIDLVDSGQPTWVAGVRWAWR